MDHKFCVDRFWNERLLNRTSFPVFTRCFQYSLIIISSSIFIAAYVLFIVLKLYQRCPRICRVNTDVWYFLKMGLQVMLVLMLVLEIFTDKVEYEDAMHGLSYFVLCSAVVLAMTLTEIRRRTLHPTCPILFAFWLMTTVTYFVRLYDNIAKFIKYHRIHHISLSAVSMVLILLSFLLECFHRYSEKTSVMNRENPCPEEYASIPSQLTYFWMDRYIFKWFHKEMTEETAFNLREIDETTKNTNALETAFTKIVEDSRTRFRKAAKKRRKRNIQFSNMSEESSLLSDGDDDGNTEREIDFKSNFSLIKSLVKINSSDLLISWLYEFVHDILVFTQPFLLKFLLMFIQNENSYPWQGYCLAVAFLLSGVFGSIAENLCFYLTTNISIRVRASLIGIIYRKALRISNEARCKYTSGDIVNMMSVDTERVMNCIIFSWSFFSCPLQIGIALVLLYTELKYAVFAGLGVILLFFPINGLVMNYCQQFSEIELDWKDNRMKLLTEIMKGIKVIKMYAWETSFISKVRSLRKQEIKYIRYVSIGSSIVNALWEILPFFVMIVTFIVFVYSDISNIITAERAFVSLALFNLIRYPMTVLPWSITDSISAYVSLKRISEFLMEEEIKTDCVYFLEDDFDKSSDDIVVEIKDGSFCWKKNDQAVLKDINLNVRRGQLIAIVGKVGTGKTSLLSAMLGEMVKINGFVKMQGDVAYVPQEAWIRNMSVKENILFMSNLDEELYKKVLEACALGDDLKQMLAGDETEIGERGINLSGGQKQRVSLARAAYQMSDVYLFDDPLSAVDAHVGMHIFENVISNNGILKDETRILVTHGVHWLPKVDEIVVLNSEGTISERGSYKELMDNGKDFQKFIQEYVNSTLKVSEDANCTTEDDSVTSKAKILLREMPDDEHATEKFVELISKTPTKMSGLFSTCGNEVAPRHRTLSETYVWKPKKIETSGEHQAEMVKVTNFFEKAKSPRTSANGPLVVEDEKLVLKPLGQLTDEEHAMSGNVSCKSYVMYFMAWGFALVLMAFLLFAVYASLQVYGNFVLEDFTSDPFLLNASSLIDQNRSYIPLLSDEIRKITNSYVLRYSIIGASELVTVIGFYTCLTIATVRASKTILKKLLETILRSPMSFFDTTPTGRILNRFSKDIESVDHLLPFVVSDCIGCIFILISALVVVVIVTPWFAAVIVPLLIVYYFVQRIYMPTSRQSRRLDSIAASPIFNHFTETIQGASVIRAFKEQNRFQNLNESLVDRSTRFKFIQYSSSRWLSVRLDMIGNLTVFAAVAFCIIFRRDLTAGLVGLSISYALQITDNLNWLVRQYSELETDLVSVERLREYSTLPSEASWRMDTHISSDWPNKGSIKLVDYNLKYRDESPMVLKKITFHINGGEKIGIVGRTGAGKSSLSAALFRLVESAGGRIIIDDVDISTVGLHDLRERLTILPQDPLIYSGTLRENLDPFNKYSENELFECLEKSFLKEWVIGLAQGLDYECGEGGANLSAGQKQLLCLARALLRKSKVLILDEATASVDVETDRLVMRTVKDYFKNSSVLIIAHRINTIMDCDRIVVLENGEIKEFDTPNRLLENPDSLFKSLAKQSAENDLQ